MTKRVFDICFSAVMLVILSPLFLLVTVLIAAGSKGGVFFAQERVGRFGKRFKLFKFRTMQPNSEAKGQLTVGGRDSRITPIGYVLRKFKLDELPQLFNVLKGEMSVVGPRPEVPKYVALYSEEQLSVLNVRPGLTDYASIQYVNENEVLGASKDPGITYVQEIMPHKLALNLKYIAEVDMGTDLQVIVKTAAAILR